MLTIFYSMVHDLTGRGPGTKLAEDFYPPAGLIKFVVNNVLTSAMLYITASQAEEAATEVPWLKVKNKTKEMT